jgi:glyoxylase-like metal-dependent hydrolase (beta-lactamase superfamily II)
VSGPGPVASPTYRVLALRYAVHAERTAAENFLHPADPSAIMPLDYYLWAILGPDRTIIVDTGCSADSLGERPGRALVAPVEDLLGAAGIDCAGVADVVLTHMHYDHAGRLELFPAATIHVQDREMAFCTGRAMGFAALRGAFRVDDVMTAVRHVHAGRMLFHDGTAEIAPGVTLHLVGGHTAGTQVVRVPTERGWVVLASDTTHLWANIRGRNPFPIVADVTAMLEGYRLVESLADGPDHVIPGHDPLVRNRFPSLAGHPEIVRLDAPPLPETAKPEPGSAPV